MTYTHTFDRMTGQLSLHQNMHRIAWKSITAYLSSCYFYVYCIMIDVGWRIFSLLSFPQLFGCLTGWVFKVLGCLFIPLHHSFLLALVLSVVN